MLFQAAKFAVVCPTATENKFGHIQRITMQSHLGMLKLVQNTSRGRNLWLGGGQLGKSFMRSLTSDFIPELLRQPRAIDSS